MREQSTAVMEFSPSNPLAEIELRLQGKLRGRILEFQMLRHECGLVLRGIARTYHAKQLAQHAVMTETDVPILANEIEVC
jgi:hypothetical protein